MIEFNCPKCHKPMRVKPEYAGRTGKCHGCGEKLVVPQTATNSADVWNELHSIQPAAVAASRSAAPKTQPIGIWRGRNSWKQAVVVLDSEVADPSTFPRVCMYLGVPVNKLRRMTIQDQDTKTSGGVIRHSVTNFDIDLPISDEAYEYRVKRSSRIRKLLFLVSFLILIVLCIGGAVAEYVFHVPNAMVIAIFAPGAALVPFTIAVAFPYLKDFASDPNVIYSVRFGTEFTIFKVHEKFLDLLPEGKKS